MKYLFLLNSLAILFFSCQRNKTDRPAANNCISSSQLPTDYPSDGLSETYYNNTHCGFMPLGKKNYWVYLDSLFDSNGGFTGTKYDTLKFTKTYYSTDSIVWWEPNVFKGFFRFNYSTDSILYTLGDRWGNRLLVEWAKPLITDSTNDECIYTDHATLCKAWKINEPVNVPAGSFNQCFHYRKLWFLGNDFDFYFKPGVGVLKFWYYSKYPDGRMKPATISTLVNFHLE